MSSMTSTIKRTARLSLVAVAAASAMATSAAAADRTTRTDTSTRTSIVIAAPDQDGTGGKETCVGSQLACGPGSKFHAACDALNGGYEGSNPDPATNIPQTWSCRVP